MRALLLAHDELSCEKIETNAHAGRRIFGADAADRNGADQDVRVGDRPREHLRGLNREQHALTKRLQVGFATRGGLMAALLAQKGLNGFDGLTDLADPSSVGVPKGMPQNTRQASFVAGGR